MTRPNRPLYATATERTFECDGIRYVFRQVGWIGQSGDFYSLGEDPASTEPGSFDPLWFIAHSDRVDDYVEMLAAERRPARAAAEHSHHPRCCCDPGWIDQPDRPCPACFEHGEVSS